MSRTHKRKSVSYEYQFFTRALEEDLDVFIPAGDYLHQDCLVMNGAGRVFKVQIKGTASAITENRSTPRYKIQACTGSANKVPIDCTKVDIVVAYIAPRNVFYVVPCLELAHTVGPWFYPDSQESKGKYEIYRENWGLFKAA